MDAGIATEANLAWLREQNCRYLVVSRKRHVEWDEELSQIVRVQGTNKWRTCWVLRTEGRASLITHANVNLSSSSFPTSGQSKSPAC